MLVSELEFGAEAPQRDLPEQTVHIIFAIFRPWSRRTHKHMLIFKKLACLKLNILSDTYPHSAEMF